MGLGVKGGAQKWGEKGGNSFCSFLFSSSSSSSSSWQNVKLLEQFVCPHSGSIFHGGGGGQKWGEKGGNSFCSFLFSSSSSSSSSWQNVKLLEQFVCPHSGSIFHPTHTGVCMKQHKLLLKAIAQAQDHGLLWLRVPFVPPPSDNYLTPHSAIGKTPPGPQLREGRVWYPWYEWQQPPAAAIARLRRIYKDYLKEEEKGGGGAAEALGEGQKAGSEMGVEGQKGGVEGQKGGTEG
uniref:Small ribosomal subunit protein mS40 n=1 Tax=Chrysolophus pictus TaxID=9089 RepID=A0A8C3LAR6_CHRPC